MKRKQDELAKKLEELWLGVPGAELAAAVAEAVGLSKGPARLVLYECAPGA